MKERSGQTKNSMGGGRKGKKKKKKKDSCLFNKREEAQGELELEQRTIDAYVLLFAQKGESALCMAIPRGVPEVYDLPGVPLDPESNFRYQK